MWLKIIKDGNNKLEWQQDIKGYKVLIDSSDVIYSADSFLYRTSPIFPVVADFRLPENNYSIYFYCFESAFTVLGRILSKGSTSLKRNVFFSLGIASILVITDDSMLIEEMMAITSSKLKSKEIWTIKDGAIDKIEPDIELESSLLNSQSLNRIVPYGNLPCVIKATVDEFVANMSLILPKISLHMAYELEVFIGLYDQINELVVELVFLYELSEKVPASLDEYVLDDFINDASLKEKIIHQNIGRLIQVNAALSNLSVQALSGAIPILERRSLLRRYSLLGIGSGVIALTNIARSIEEPFSKYPIEDIIKDRMLDAGALRGLEELPSYDCSSWRSDSVNKWKDKFKEKPFFPKLSYYSYRLGYRESEYSISAAVQSIIGGADLDWSLLTITHEMVHGHVRKIYAQIFQGQANLNPDIKWRNFDDRFKKKLRRQLKDENMLDSLRAIIFTYCCFASTSGSISHEYQSDLKEKIIKQGSFKIKGLPLDFYIPRDSNQLYNLLANEQRNIHEIFVHILDFHYFYGSKLEAFIPLVWHTWSSVPHVRGDLRQYILRSLLTIAVTVDSAPLERFYESLDIFRELLDKYFSGENECPIILDVRRYLRGENILDKLFKPFAASLILVDMVNNIFFCENIRSALMDDPNILFVPDENAREEKFQYVFSEDFIDDVVKKPAAYLLDRILKKLEDNDGCADLESETTMMLLACCSNYEKMK